MYVYVRCKVWIRTIRGSFSTNLGSLVCAANPRIAYPRKMRKKYTSNPRIDTGYAIRYVRVHAQSARMTLHGRFFKQASPSAHDHQHSVFCRQACHGLNVSSRQISLGENVGIKTITSTKGDRIISNLSGRYSEEDAHFRFWVKSREFKLMDYPALGFQNILCMPSKTKVCVKHVSYVSRMVPIYCTFTITSHYAICYYILTSG